jgi:hypothetical protein
MSVPRSTHSSHRKAFGPRKLSAATKAQYVAESILLHEAEGHTWTLAQYGLDVQSEQWQLVLGALGALRKQQAAGSAATKG